MKVACIEFQVALGKGAARIGTGKETTMKIKRVLTITAFTALLAAAFAALNPLPKMDVAVVAASGGKRELALTKNCTQYFAAGGAAGSFCTITSSNLQEI